MKRAQQLSTDLAKAIKETEDEEAVEKQKWGMKGGGSITFEPTGESKFEGRSVDVDYGALEARVLGQVREHNEAKREARAIAQDEASKIVDELRESSKMYGRAQLESGAPVSDVTIDTKRWHASIKGQSGMSVGLIRVERIPGPHCVLQEAVVMHAIVPDKLAMVTYAEAKAMGAFIARLLSDYREHPGHDGGTIVEYIGKDR
jgi:hypothetical protein